MFTNGKNSLRRCSVRGENDCGGIDGTPSSSCCNNVAGRCWARARAVPRVTALTCCHAHGFLGAKTFLWETESDCASVPLLVLYPHPSVCILSALRVPCPVKQHCSPPPITHVNAATMSTRAPTFVCSDTHHVHISSVATSCLLSCMHMHTRGTCSFSMHMHKCQPRIVVMHVHVTACSQDMQCITLPNIDIIISSLVETESYAHACQLK